MRCAKILTCFLALPVLTILGCTESPRQEIPAFENLTDLNFKRICVIKGSIDEQYVGLKYPKSVKMSYENIEELYDALEKGECDGGLVASDYATGEYLNAYKEIGVLQDSVFVTDEISVAIAKQNNIQESKIYNLTILHTGNHGGAMFSQNGFGGLAERATFFNQIRSKNRNVIILDAGNLNGESFASRYHNAMPDIKAYNAMEYTATVFGNRDFDNPLFQLREQMDSSQFNWLGINVRDNIGSGDYIGKPYIIKNIDGLRVGIIGVSSTGMRNMAMHAKQVQWINEIATARRTVKQLRSLPKNERANIIILLANFGDAPNIWGGISAETLADSVQGINLIVHSSLPEQLGSLKIRNNIPMVSAGANGKSVGMANIQVKKDEVIYFSWNSMPILTSIYEPDPEILKMLLDYTNKIPEDFKSTVMTTTAKFNQFNSGGENLSYRQETAFGDLISDAMTWLGKKQGKQIDFSIINGGFIRGSLPEGMVTKKDIAEALPYDNVLKIISMRGSDVAKLFEFIAGIPLGSSAFPQVSKEVKYKLTYTHDNGKATGKISDLRINDSPIDSSKIYNIVTTNFLLEGGDNYPIFKNNKGIYNISMPVRSAVTEYAKILAQPVTPSTDERIKVIEQHSFENARSKRK